MGRPPLGVKRVQFMLPPKLIVRIRKIQLVPMIAAVRAAVRPVLRAGEDHVRIVGPREDRVHFGVRRQSESERCYERKRSGAKH